VITWECVWGRRIKKNLARRKGQEKKGTWPGKKNNVPARRKDREAKDKAENKKLLTNVFVIQDAGP
jgi:hypothetical protein